MHGAEEPELDRDDRLEKFLPVPEAFESLPRVKGVEEAGRREKERGNATLKTPRATSLTRVDLA